MRTTAFLSLLFILVVGLPAQAQRGRPASLLVFAEYDNATPGVEGLFTITNTNPVQPVDVELVFIRAPGCLEFNRLFRLTPSDTVTLLSSAGGPNASRGFMYAFAKNPATGQAIAFNHLAGTSTVFDGSGTISYTIEPFTFRAVGNEGTPTDIDSDGRRDLDGIEYEVSADRLDFPRFLAQGPAATTDVVLINLTGSVQFEAVVLFTIYNDNTEFFTRTFAFHCWTRLALSSVSGAFSQAFLATTLHDPAEIHGWPQQEAGWFNVDGLQASSPAQSVLDPAILAVLVERAPQSSAVMPYKQGSQSNGSLINLSIMKQGRSGTLRIQDPLLDQVLQVP